MKLKIRQKLTLLIVSLALVSVIVGAAAFLGFTQYRKELQDIELSAERVRYGEQINGLVYATVMESRGLYMSRGADEIEKFSKPLLSHLTTIQQKMNEWKAISNPEYADEFAKLEKAAGDFVAFRSELVKQAQTGGSESARNYGDNEQNRSNRKAFNESLSKIAEFNNADIKAHSEEALALHKKLVILISLLIGIGVTTCVAVSLYVVRKYISAPLHNLDIYLGDLSNGDLSRPVPFQERHDEVGTMSRSIVNLREGLLHEAELTRKAEEQRKIDAYYRGQVTAINRSQATIEFEPDGTITAANDHFLNTMGYSLGEIVGRHHSMFAEPSYASSAEYRSFWEKLRAGEFQTGEYKRLGKGGKEVWIRASYNPIFDDEGKVFKVVKFASDTTREKLENADYEGQINAINKSQAVIHFNMDGTIIKANDIFLDAMGYTLNEITGQHHSMFVDATESQGTEYRQFWDSLRNGTYDARVFRRITKDGRYVWLQASYNPIFDLNGKPFKVVKYATDVTDMIDLTDETGQNVQSVAAATEEMSASIAEISTSMARSKMAMNDIVEKTQTSGNASAELLSTMRQMEQIVSMIKDIADKVNLLALNATIEAARAGDAGKGFAVVANEVKNLASQTASATDDIVKEIAAIQSISRQVADSVSDIVSSANSVNEYVSGVAGAIEEQSAIVKEISSNSQTTSAAVIMISDKIKKRKSSG